MNANLQKWLPIALCCLPGVAIVAIVGIGAAVSGASLNGPLGLGLIALAMLACPASMVLMMRRESNRNSASDRSRMMADCCAPGEVAATIESDRLAALRTRREALQREVAKLEADAGASTTVTGTPTKELT